MLWNLFIWHNSVILHYLIYSLWRNQQICSLTSGSIWVFNIWINVIYQLIYHSTAKLMICSFIGLISFWTLYCAFNIFYFIIYVCIVYVSLKVIWIEKILPLAKLKECCAFLLYWTPKKLENVLFLFFTSNCAFLLQWKHEKRSCLVLILFSKGSGLVAHFFLSTHAFFSSIYYVLLESPL